jgi:tryptophan synthase alpha chain
MRSAHLSGQERLRAQFGNQLALIGYVPFGDPDAPGERHLAAYSNSGVSVLEIGIPTADPYLDGPEVRDSMRRAHAAGASPFRIAEGLAQWRAKRRNGPAIVWMAYPDLSLEAIEYAAGLGVIDGVLIVDETKRPDHRKFAASLAALRVGHCAFVSWAASDAELKRAARATGYVMVQARPGPTGTGNPPGVPARQVAKTRLRAPSVPVVVGFGVEDSATLRRVSSADVDGVVVGSACVKALREGGAAALRSLLRSLATEASALSRRPVA